MPSKTGWLTVFLLFLSSSSLCWVSPGAKKSNSLGSIPLQTGSKAFIRGLLHFFTWALLLLPVDRQPPLPTPPPPPPLPGFVGLKRVGDASELVKERDKSWLDVVEAAVAIRRRRRRGGFGWELGEEEVWGRLLSEIFGGGLVVVVEEDTWPLVMPSVVSIQRGWRREEEWPPTETRSWSSSECCSNWPG